MGNKLGRRRSVVDEKYTRPQGLYLHKDIDIKKLKKLILESKLAPCYPGDEECSRDLEECPICFLSYPSLNRSKCCSKRICTECFLQLKMPNSTRPTQCPFCKTTNYAVEYRGMKTKKEKSIEQIEEQRVIEAKIRMRQQELLEEEVKLQRRLETTPSNRRITSSEGNYREATDSYSGLISNPSRPPRNGEFIVDLEDLMVMEAIWLSMQEIDRSTTSGDYITSEEHSRQDFPYVSQTTPTSSYAAGGLANVIATLAENQQTSRDCSARDDNSDMPISTIPSHHRMFHGRHNNQNIDTHDEIQRATQRAQDSLESFASSATHGDSFEEQMTLAMTVSLAEARAMTSTRR